MKKTKIMILGTLVMLLVASSISANVAGKSTVAKKVESNMQANLIVEHASTTTWGQIYRPGGELIRVEDNNEGLNGCAKAYDEEPKVSAAHTFNKASGKMNNGLNSFSAKKMSNGIILEHREHQAAGQLVPMDKSACAMGITDTEVNFFPKAAHDGMVRLEVSISYSIMVTATEDYVGQSFVSVQYFDEYNIDQWSFELNERIDLQEAGSEGISDTYSFYVDVPTGTHCYARIGTGGASGSLQQEGVTGMCQALADISVTITVA